MLNTNQWIRLVLSALGALLWSSSLSAQDNPEAGEGGQMQGQQGQMGGGFGGQYGAQGQGAWQPQPVPGQMPPPGGEPPPGPGVPAYPPREVAPPPPPPGGSDHAAFVGSFGVGFFGVMTLPIIRCEPVVPACTPLSDLAPAPTIGVRYWLGETLGIEAALGLNVTNGANGNVDNSLLGFALHGGVPLALAHTGHFVFEIVPQLNFGVASGSYETTGVTNDVSGLLIEAGAKVGGEVHFGFIDIPQLSLQGTVGLMVRHESRSLETIMGTFPATTVEQSETRIATGVDGEPWDVFTGTITAIYYL